MALSAAQQLRGVVKFIIIIIITIHATLQDLSLHRNFDQ
jgi:hypothetical protein